MFYYYDAKNITSRQQEAALHWIANLKSKGAEFTRDEESLFREGFLAGYQVAEKTQREARQVALASIDWYAVEPLPEVDRWENVPGYQERHGHF